MHFTLLLLIFAYFFKYIFVQYMSMAQTYEQAWCWNL